MIGAKTTNLPLLGTSSEPRDRFYGYEAFLFSKVKQELVTTYKIRTEILSLTI